MIASTRLICFSSTLSAAFCIPANGPTLGSMPMMLCIDPIFFTWRSWSRKSSSEKPSPAKRPAGHLLRFFLVDALLGLLDQRQNVAHAENARDDAVGMERLERIVLFADADELDGLAGDLANRKRRAAAGIAVHLGEDDAGQRQLLVELVGGVDRVLSGHGVGDEQDLLRIEQSASATASRPSADRRCADGRRCRR